MLTTFEKRRARPARSATAIAIIFLLLAHSSACLDRNANTNDANRGAQASSVASGEQTGAAKSARSVEETLAADAPLAAIIDREIDEGAFSSARWGVAVVSLRDGRTVYAREAERLFTPASVMKVYTTAVALDMLGADYRWRTSVYADGAPDSEGTIRGDLVLYGRGAPDLLSRAGSGGSSDFAALADELYRGGVRRVRGDVIGDESYFRGEMLGGGWLWEDAQWYYGAQPSALSVDGNEITLRLAPASKVDEPVEVKLVPPTDYVRITNDARTIERGARPTLGVTRSLSSNDVRVWGEFPAGGAGYGVRLSVYRPALWAAHLFREALRARGIEVRGEARARDARATEEDRFDPERAKELAHVLSRPLGEIVREVNKESLNLEAELVLRTLGKERGADAPDPDPRKNRTRNTDAAGLALVRRWLEQSGIETQGIALHDGSGLSRLDLVTPGATARLLVRIAETSSAEVFRASLPVAGRDGTLQGRMQNAPAGSSIVAKTGSLTYVNGLAGYATTADGEPLAFAIFCNDKTQGQSSLRAIDAIALALTRHPRRER